MHRGTKASDPGPGAVAALRLADVAGGVLMQAPAG